MNNSVSEQKPIVATAVIAVAALIVTFMVMMRVDKFLRVKAVDDCGRISRYETANPGENLKVWYPQSESYAQCMKDKGYEVIQ